MRQWIFWQQDLSIHQAPLMTALAHAEGEGRVAVVCAGGLNDHREALGWSAPAYAPARLYVAPDSAQLADLLAASAHMGAIHVFSGLRAVPQSWRVLKRLGGSGAAIGIYAESGRSDLAVRRWLRRLAYRVESRPWRNRCSLVLGIGAKGVTWWRGCGFPAELVYEFGYFVDSLAFSDSLLQTRARDTLRLIFVGNLTVRKGVDLLLRALAHQERIDWRLEVLGHGSASGDLQALARRLGIEGQVIWFGAMANDAVRQRLAGADALVLPSRWDGWGVVVNEALHVGVPVIVSDACGAACVISQPLLGQVFSSRSVDALGQALATALTEGPVPTWRRHVIQEWAQRTLGPEAAARYLVRIAEHAAGSGPRPLAPWRAEGGG